MAKTSVIKFTVTPDRQLRRTMKLLPQMVRRKAARKALNRGARVLVDAVKSNMRGMGIVRTGEGMESIGHTVQLNRLYRDELNAIVGPIGGGWYLHFIEFGTGPRVTKEGKQTGSVPAKPFMGPAFNQTIGEIQTLIAETLRAEIAKAV